MVIENQHWAHKPEVFGTVYKEGFLCWGAAATVPLNVCSIRPCSRQSTSSTALHTKLLLRVMGSGKSRHYHLLWDGIHYLEKGWEKTLLIYTLGLPEPYTSDRSFVGAQRGDQVHQGLNMCHISRTCTTWYSKGSCLLATLSFKQIPKDAETLLMKTVSSVVLTDLQFHQLNSAYWGFTKLQTECGRHCKSQLEWWTQPILLTSVFPVTVDFIRHWAHACWHPIGTVLFIHPWSRHRLPGREE